MKSKLIVGAIAIAGLFITSAPTAMAAACSGISVGTSTTSDVTLGGIDSTACDISGVNPQAGPNGNTSGFTPDLGAGWSLLAKVTSSSVNGSYMGVNYTIGFTQSSGTTGTWTVSVDQAVTTDLVFAMHASNHSGAFLFDDVALPTSSGTWTINWLNNGGNVPDYSNLTLFVRDQHLTAPVPEPETYAMMMAGLGAIGFLARRRRKV